MSSRLLSIGEFAAATQLSSKALRLYDEQKILPPAHIDSANGYRFYRAEQVAQGRLVRTLRDMGLSLMEIASVLGSTVPEIGLSRLAREQMVRHAREKRAFFKALTLIRDSVSAESPDIVQGARADGRVAVREFQADRHSFIDRFRIESDALQRELVGEGLRSAGDFRCALRDPLTEEVGTLEVIAPIELGQTRTGNIPARDIAGSPCATLTMKDRTTHSSDLSGALDAMFDWFDRRGFQALGSPWVRIDRGDGRFVEIEWAYRST
jgi:DNA-binding transcriptional MerR regulator